MAWSPNHSNGKETGFSPFLPGSAHPRLRGMIALSVAFHLLLGSVSLTVNAYRKGQPRLEPVAVVNLVGGGELPRAETEASLPRKEPAAPPPAKETVPVKAPAREPAKKKAPEPEPPDTSTVAERVRRMREARADTESVRSAVEARRSEAAARAAVRGVGERVARRIERSPAPARAAGAGTGIGGGSQGTVRVSLEMLEFFRKLEEKVRESWVLPEAVARDAGKLMVEMRIVIEKDGWVSDARIEKGSGNVYFDESVRRAIRKASPLPVPPERLRGGEDHYEVGFRFHGAGGEG